MISHIHRHIIIAKFFKYLSTSPHGEEGLSESTVTVIDSKSPGLYPSEIAATRLERSAQIAMEYAAFSTFAP